jgi:hypothetical protein
VGFNINPCPFLGQLTAWLSQWRCLAKASLGMLLRRQCDLGLNFRPAPCICMW